MSIDASSEFNINREQFFFRKFLTLNKESKNRFSLNSKNEEIQKIESISKTGTFKRPLSNAEGNSSFRNWKTLGRPNFRKSTLDQTEKNFSNDGISNECTNVSENPHTQKDASFIKTLKRNVSMRFLNSKKTEEIEAHLENAKTLFKDSKYEESKNVFILLEKFKQSEACLYLTAIYLLEQKGSKANKYLKGVTNLYLKTVMKEHVEHLLDPKKKDSPFPKVSFYDCKTEPEVVDNRSEDEKIVMDRLFLFFKEKDSIQDITENK